MNASRKAVITNCIIRIMDGYGYMIKYYIMEYADPNKNITIGKNGTGEIPITDD